MKMFLLPEQISDQIVLYDIQFMASNRHPEVTLLFTDPDCRFYLSSDELIKLRSDHAGYFNSSSVPMRVDFEYERGERLEGLLSGGGREFATVVRAAHRDRYKTSYEVTPDYVAPPPRPKSKWRRWRGRPQPAPPPQPVIWPKANMFYMQGAAKSRPANYDDID